MTETAANPIDDDAYDRTAPGLAQAAGARGQLDLTVLRTRDEVAGVGDAWDTLFAGRLERRFSLARYWCQQMWPRLEADPRRRPLVIVGWADGECRLVWPLVTYRAKFWRVTQPMFEDLSDYDDILVADDPRAGEWCRQAWRFMIAETRPDMVVCRRVPADSPLDRVIGERRWCWERRSASPYVDFRKVGGWQGYHASLSKKTRSTNRNRRNRLARFGPVGFTAVTEPREARRLIAWMFEQKRRRLGARAHGREEKTTSDHFGHDMPFLVDVTQRAFDAGQLRVFRLSAGESTVAVLTGVVSGRSMMGWLYAYSPEFMSGGPGRMVLMESLAWACREGFEIVDFLPDPEPYKAEWTDLVLGVRDVRLPVTPWGRVLVAWYCSPVRRLLMALYMRMPKSIQHLARRAAT